MFNKGWIEHVLPVIGFSQERISLSGYMRDESTGEALHASIYVKEIKSGVNTNEYVFFSITLPKGTYHFDFSYIGYQANHVEIILIKNLQQNQSLSPLNISLEEITVTGQSKDNMVRQNELGSLRMDVKEMSEIPVLFGEKDI